MPDTSHDQNVLFGVVAWQMGFVDRDTLMAAMYSWTTDKTLPLPDLLQQRGALTAPDRQLVEQVVERKLGRNAGNAGLTLSDLAAAEGVCGDLKRAAAQSDSATVVHAEAVDRSAATIAHRATIDAAPPGENDAKAADNGEAAGASRFRVVRPHARGGLGEVFVAMDDQLHREVALKEILSRHAHNQISRMRFLREAEVTGNLEHPGVVPVYGLGTHPDGRPYYAMRFIRGESLDDAVRRFHNPPNENRSEGDRALELRTLLTRFVAVCNTIEYAHSRGFVHRDLKPENVMLGPYGETLVVDWGLARPFGTGAVDELEMSVSSESDADAPNAAASQTIATPTQMGAIVGTPQFMSPEQAKGRIDLIGPAGDVYGLGATLYTLLTDEPPFTSLDVRQVLEAVKRGDFPPPRQVQRDVPPALEAICLKAMSLKPEDRYASARALAGDIEHWMADEPVSAAKESAMDRASRWVRRHKTSSQAAAVAIVLIAIVTAVAYVREAGLHVQLQDTLSQEQQARRDADDSRRRADDNARIADRERHTAEAHARRADEQSALALATLRTVLDDVQVKLKNVPAAHAVRLGMLERVIDGLKQVARSLETADAADHSLVKAHLDLGDAFLQVGSADTASATEEAHRQFERAVALAERRATAVPTDANAKGDLAAAYRRMGDVSLQRGGLTSAASWFQKSLTLYDELAAARPTDLDLRRALAEVVQRTGLVHQQLGDLPQTKTAYRRFFELAESLLRDDAKEAGGRRRLSVAYERLGDLSLWEKDDRAAEENFKKCLEVRKAIVAEDQTHTEAQRDLSVTLDRLGDLALARNDVDAAAKSYDESRALREKLAESDPENVQAQRDLMVSYLQLGDVDMLRNNAAAAETDYRRSHALALKLSSRDPANLLFQRDLATSYERLGYLHLTSERFAEAREAYVQNAAVLQKAYQSQPRNPQARSELASALAMLGDIEHRAGDPVAARRRLTDYVDFARRELVEVDDAATQATFVDALIRAADASLQIGEFKTADGLLSEAQTSVDRRPAAERNDGDRLQASTVYSISAQLEIERRDAPKAAQLVRRAIEVIQAAGASQPPGEVEAAQIAELKKLLELCLLAERAVQDSRVITTQEPTVAIDLYDFRAAALVRSGKLSEAAEVVEKMASLDPTSAATLAAAGRAAARLTAAHPKDSTERKSSADRAVKLLQSAAEASKAADPVLAARLEHGDDFSALRARADFATLIASLRGPIAKAPNAPSTPGSIP